MSGVVLLLAITFTILIASITTIATILIPSFGSPSINMMLNNKSPTINIVTPTHGSTIVSDKVEVNGTAFDSADGIQKVEVLIHPYPFDGTFDFQEASPIKESKVDTQNSEVQLEDDESDDNQNSDESDNSEENTVRENSENVGPSNIYKWSITLPIENPAVYRILAHAIDGAGIENWTETRINVPFIPSLKTTQVEPIKQIAIVGPTFTTSAYLPDAFYTFYGKHQFTKPGENITTDTEMLTTKINPPDYYSPESIIDVNNLTAFSHLDPDNLHNIPISKLGNHLHQLLPNNTITLIRDEDIHNGNIFLEETEQNAYDMLIVFHEEYVTQQMYNNFKKFVSNGGNILFIDGNILFAEVNYNQKNNTITLVKGHGWEFDGKSAKRSVEERWFNENKDFIGSNFLLSRTDQNITFTNNPYNYTHFEENFVNNDKAKVLFNYGAVIPKENYFSGSTIATYELDHQPRGKIVVIGLYGQKLLDNHLFLDFLDKLLTQNLN